MNYKIIRLNDRKELKEKAAEYYSKCFGIPESAYIESIEEAFDSHTGVPQWYLCLDGNKIIGGMGVIENDFHDRKDLAPNVCCVYTVPEYRKQGIAGKLLNYVCEDMHKKGIDTLYLITDHTSFYERYGWEFLTMVHSDDDELTRMYIHKW